MQLDRQPRSGLATVKRDFTSNNITNSPHASVPAAAATKRSTLSDSLRKAIQDGVASREVDKASPALSSLTTSQKRSLSPGAAPSAKKRQLPSSWSDFESSNATFPQGSSQSSVYFRSRSSTSSVPALDMLSHGHQEGPESSSAPFFEPKPPQRPAGISLSDEQKNILELVMQGKNIFYTGSAGVSSFPWFLYLLPILPLFGLLCRALKDRHCRDACFKLAVTAYTPLRSVFEEG